MHTRHIIMICAETTPSQSQSSPSPIGKLNTTMYLSVSRVKAKLFHLELVAGLGSDGVETCGGHNNKKKKNTIMMSLGVQRNRPE